MQVGLQGSYTFNKIVVQCHQLLQVFEQIVSHAKAGHAVTGSCFWMTASSAYPDYDGMTVYFRPPTPEVESQNAELMVKNAQPDQQQCAADSPQSSLGALQSKLQGQVSSLLDHARHSNKSVVEVIRHNAKIMHELNKQGKECKVM
jgi:hypothetical protein